MQVVVHYYGVVTVVGNDLVQGKTCKVKVIVDEKINQNLVVKVEELDETQVEKVEKDIVDMEMVITSSIEVNDYSFQIDEVHILNLR